MSNTEKNNAIWPLTDESKQREELQQISDDLLAELLQLLENENIPATEQVIHNHHRLFVPFCDWLVKQQIDRPLIVGINGSQGSGKSTLTKILKTIIEQGFDKTVVSLSIDDLYKTKYERQKMAEVVHPLFSTRGVPGTHDTNLGISVLNHLLEGNHNELAIPVFDKSIDDRLPVSQWPVFKGQCDIVLFEGWCVGAIAENEESLNTPVNTLEQFEDEDASWRHIINNQLKNDYSDLFSLIDLQVLMKIPGFEKVYEWRELQENKLKVSSESDTDSSLSIMSNKEIKRFIMHYERITKHTLKEMPDRCDIVFEINDEHQIQNVIARCD